MIFRLFFFVIIFTFFVKADVVRPALVELSFHKNKSLELSFHINLEAIISEISNKYKDTKKSPNSNKYDELRVLKEKELFKRFKDYENYFLKNFSLKIDGKKVKLKLKSHKIDFIGYTKRARKSILVYEASLSTHPKNFIWKYYAPYGDSSFRYRLYVQDEYTWSDWMWVVADKSSPKVLLGHLKFETQIEKFFKFIKIGFYHVIPLGMDHILFIVAMALSLLPWRQLLILVTSFTIAHSLTLALSMLEITNIKAEIIEPLIALSIAYVAIENLLSSKSLKRKTIIVFIFGLLHGLGFAYMLKSFESNSDNFISTLAGFNIGVEIAQICIIFAVLFVFYFIRKISSDKIHKYFVYTSLSSISLIGLYWFFDRLSFS